MDARLNDWRSVGFGADPLNPYAPRPSDSVVASSTDKLRRQVLQSCPRVPGVYGMLDRRGKLIYVGKSKSLRSRLTSYFAASNSEAKGGRIIESARAILWETQPSEFAALVREQQLIRQHSPRWNVQGVPKRQRPVYLCLGRSPACFFLASIPPAESVAAEGPFHGAGRMKLAIDSLNKVFKLRDCSQKQVFHFAEQLQLFDLEHRPGCLRYEVGTCAGPCAAGCTRQQYDAHVNAAQSFLDGFNDEPLLVLREQLQRANECRQYELAGRIYETLKSMEYVERKLTMLASARRRFDFIYPVPGYDGLGIWYLIRGGEIVDAAASPKPQESNASLIAKLRHWASISGHRPQRGHDPHAPTLQLVAAWFRKHRHELDHTFSIAQAANGISADRMTA